MIKKIIFKGITFYNIELNDLDKLFKKKGLFLFPSGPGLTSIESKKEYHNALKNSDINFFDSGYFVLLLKLLKNIKVNKFSGYKFFKFYIKFLQKNKNIKILSIDPNKNLSNSNKKLFKKIGHNGAKIFNYIAPFYNTKSFSDKKLLKIINKIKPNHILINIGGGTQEVLGFYLKKKIDYKCNILCTGAAISYFTKDQAPMNDFIDSLYLGWLIRIIFKPSIFLPRYLMALKLFNLVLNNKVKTK